MYLEPQKVREKNEPEFIADFKRSRFLCVRIEWAAYERDGVIYNRLLPVKKQDVWELAKMCYVRYEIDLERKRMIIY